MFAEDYLFAFDKDGTVRQVTKDGDNYKFKDGKIAYSPTFILGQNFGNGGFTFGYNLTPYRSNIGSSIAIGSNTKATQEYAIAFGYDTESAGKNAVAIGKNTKANNENAIAIGHQATVVVDPTKSTPAHAIAIGSSAKATSVAAIALGRETTASNGQAIAIGDYAKSSGTATIAIGDQSEAAVNKAIAIGHRAKADKRWSIAFGLTTEAKGESSIAIGQTSKALEKQSVAIGYGAKSSGENAFAFGSEAEAQKDNSIAFGNNAKAQEKEAIAIGSQAIAKKDETVAVGKRAQALADKTTAIGSNSQASNMNSTAVGYFANADGSSATALGAGTYAENNSVAIGVNAKARGDGKNSIVIGQNTLTQSENTIVIGSNSQIGEGINTDKSYNSIAIGNDIKINRIINNAIALGYKAEVTSSENIAIGSNAKALHLYSSAIGTSAEAENESAAFGHSANAKMGSTAFGYQAKADKNSNAIGMSSVATGQYSSAIGHEAKATGNYSTAIGWDTQARGEDSIAMGGYTTASKNAIAMGRAAHAATNSVSIGYLADANNNANSVALGGNTRTDADGSVALGSYSWANRGELNYTGKYYVYRPAGYDEGIDATIKNTKGAVSVGKSGKDGFTRQIINVAAGSEDSDAVNVAQLKAVGKKGLNFKTDFGDDTQVLEDRFKNNSIHKSLGSTVAINGDYVLPFSATINGEPARIYDFLSGNNLATSVNEDGSIKLLMAKSPEFEGIEFGDKAKDDDFVYITRGDRSNSLAFYSYDKNNKENPTILENIAAGTKDTDAVNVSQLIKSSEGNRTKYFSVKSSEIGNADNKGAKAENAMAIGPNAIVETNAASSVALGYGAKVEANAESAIAIGHKASAKKTNSIAIGSNTKAGESSVVIGLNAKTGGEVDRTVYNKIKREFDDVSRKYNLAVKKNNKEKIAEFGKEKDELEERLNNIDIMYEGKLITREEYNKLTRTKQKNATFVTNVTYKNSVAIGNDAQVIANDTVAIGSGAKVIAQGGVAIGQGSVSNARENKDLKGYIPPTTDQGGYEFTNNQSAWVATNQPFAVGNDEKKITRQITGVAAGKEDTDAVNVAQLKEVGFHILGDTGEKGRIQNDDGRKINTLHIKTDEKWKNNDVVYTGRNLETKTIAGGSFDSNKKEYEKSKVEIAMSDTPRFKSITIADENTVDKDGKVVDKSDNSPIELKKFDDNIGFAGKGDKTVKLTNLADGSIAKDSKDAVTGKQLYEVQEKTNTLANTSLNFADNNNNIIKRKLGDTLRISGGQNADIKEDDFTIGENIGVFKKDNENLTVALAKNLQDINSLKGQGNNSAKITLGGENNNSISVNGGKITNLADATDKTDAVNKGQLDEVAKNSKAAINKGLNFQGDDKQNINKKLGDTLSITGGITDKAKLSSNNIGVYKNKDGSLTVALSKNLTGLESVTTGDTVINNSGVTIKDGTDDKVTLTKDGLTIKNGPSVKADGINAGNRKITNVADGDISANSTDAVTGKQLHNITNSLNSKVSDVTGKNNIKVESKGTEKIVSLKENIDLTNNGSIKFGDGKTEITKDKITSKDLVAKGDKQVTISGDKGTVEGLTNTTWDKNNIVENRAATEGQLQSLQNNLENNLNNTIGTTLGSYKIKGDDGVEHSIYDNKTLTTKGDTNIKTKATADGNLDIKLSKNLDLKDGSITLNNAKLDEDGLKVGDDVKITKDTIQNGDVKLTKDGLDNGDKKITNVADGVNDNDAATVRQIRHAVASAGSVKESDKKDKWAKKRPEAKGKNSVSIAGGSTDGGRNNTVSVGSKGNKRTISNVAPGVLNSDAATVGQLKAGLNNVHGKLDEYKKDSRAGTASAMAIGNLPQSTIPGKGMVSLGGGFYDGESAMAIGLSKMSDDGKWVVKGSASYDSQENAGAAVSVGFHF